MLSQPTPFPYPGSYALHIDLDAAAPQPHELVRVNWRRADRDGPEYVMISFPLRDGASGNKVVPANQLIDATPLTSDEQREFHDLDRELFGRDPRNFSKGQRARAKRRDALKRRIVYAPIMERLLREARILAERRKAA